MLKFSFHERMVYIQKMYIYMHKLIVHNILLYNMHNYGR